MIPQENYEAPIINWWQGRNDGNEWSQMRWWQIIQPNILVHKPEDLGSNSFAFLGFCSDEGVRRNKGRVGAVQAPYALRKACSNLPIHFAKEVNLYDFGNIVCANNELEAAQLQLANAVSNLLLQNIFPLLLGGGHEILYGHYSGVRKAFPDKKIGIVNFDAHFDLRKPIDGEASSGTGFYQIAEDCKRLGNDFLYFALGIQQMGNTKELFDTANNLGVTYVLAKDIFFQNLEIIKNKLLDFLAKTDVVCLTIDLDVFSAAYAPGVSAPTPNGLAYDYVVCELLHLLLKSGKVVSMDMAELNPTYDIDSRTAKLGAAILFDWVGK